jgi:acyl-CoA synthetase (AMP-forming)/AMP-acid ligase II
MTLGSATAVTSIAELLHAAATDSAERVALRGEGRELTYRQLHDVVNQAAAAWHAAGLRPGDRVAVWAGNTVDCAVTMLSVIVAGGVLVPLNPRYTVAEVSGLLARSRCRFIVATDAVAGRNLAAEVLPVADGTPVVVLGHDVPPGARAWADLYAAGANRPTPRLAPGEIAAIQFTSGTTGKPKGAMLRQAPMVSTARTWAHVVGLQPGDVFPVLYPLAHVGGFKTGIVSAAHARATMVLIPVVSASTIVDLIRAGGISVLNAPPTAQAYVLEARRRGELPGDLGIRTAVIGSAIAPPELVRALVTELGVDDVIIGYGLTEATGVCTMTRRGDPLEIPCTTIGRAIDEVEVRICPTSAADAGTSEADAAGEPRIGEIEVRGPNIMAGYLDDPQATADVMHDGWLRTGDLGWIGPDGNVRIAGRARDLVIVGGFNVYPAEIEHVLLDHPGVREAAVVGVPDQRLGEVTAAFVVGDADPDELLAWCEQRLANFKVPRHIWPVAELPRNSVGKIIKADLAAQARLRSGRGSAP